MLKTICILCSFKSKNHLAVLQMLCISMLLGSLVMNGVAMLIVDLNVWAHYICIAIAT